MILKDTNKLQRLTKTFELNGRLTVLYAAYLENFPKAITKEIMELLCGDGDISYEEGFSAILCELFGLDGDISADDKCLIRDYIPKSVRRLDAEKYKSNLYYKTVKIDNIKDGAWELRRECYPAFRGVICHDMIINEDFSEIPPLGFFTEDFEFPAVLEDGNEWMTLTPVDLDTCDFAIDEAYGKVVTFGLGLGYYAFMAAMKPEVSSVTVVEKSDKVISLFKKYILPQMPCADKIIIANKDAFEYAREDMPRENFDYAFVDIWRDASDGTPVYEKMKELECLSPRTKFSYWIENFLISRRRAVKFSEICDRLEQNEDISYKEVEDELLSLGDPLNYS
jgi:hypothetical protein